MTTELKPALRPERISMTGMYAQLVPAIIEHGPALYEATRHADDLWLWMGDGPYANLEDFGATWKKKVDAADAVFYTVLMAGNPVGYASLMRIDHLNGCVEVGNIMYSPILKQTPAATEVQYLLARYVFDSLGNRRYEWKCNSLNLPSRRAALRYGFEFEGVFRQHMIIKGKNRDTAWFAMLDSEWPTRKRALEAWIDPLNFDKDGRQKKPLTYFRE